MNYLKEYAKKFLAHPLTKGLDIDDPKTTIIRRQIIQEKAFLNKLYREWYEAIRLLIPDGQGKVLELGSGGGFLKEYIPELITSDTFYMPEIMAVMDGQMLPLADGALRALVMINVLHHVPQPRFLIKEATRCVSKGGVFILIEPWSTPWSKLVYTRLHHESFDPQALEWEFLSNGPLSDANGALAWIIFDRDKDLFIKEFPGWQTDPVRLMMPFRYLLSGGISMRSLMHPILFYFWKWVEELFKHWFGAMAMFAEIKLTRI